MKVYEFGDETKPVIVLLPGTCCSWRSFDGVRDGLTKQFRVACVSYDGFDENENTTFLSMQDEVEKIEDYILQKHGGEICAVYGCSLGGTFVGLLAARNRVHIHYGIIGSSDFDTTGPFLARLETKVVVKLFYPLMQTGRMQGIFGRIFDKRMQNADDYSKNMMKSIGVGNPRPYVSKESIANQFYTDLITVLPDQLDNPRMQIHVLYAKKMGEKYLKRYHKYLKNPVIHEDDLRHEELLCRYPERWVQRIENICGIE